MKSIEIKAPAKINLGLDVIRKREDGYHEVCMVMQTISLYDYLTITTIPDDTISLSTNLPYLPTNENNLVFKAAKLLKLEFAIKEGVKINLVKHIPVAAGLAGGSTDAAATLLGLNQLFELNLSKQDLMDRAVSLGADIPYCIMGGTAISEGIGEILTPLPSIPPCHIVIVKPHIHVSTKYVYEHLELDKIRQHPDIKGMVESIHSSDYCGVTKRLGNVLETVTEQKYPVIKKIKETLLKFGADGSLMSGSGPTVFALFQDKKKAQTAMKACKELDDSNQVFLSNIFNRIER